MESQQGRGIRPRHAALLQPFVLFLLLPLALLSLGRGLRNAIGDTAPGRSTDLYPYWLGGYRLTLNQDPYRVAIETDEVPTERAVSGINAQRSITNLPPMLLVLAPLSFLPWPDAKLIAALSTTSLALLIPWIPLGWLAKHLSLSKRIALALAFYALLPTRNAIANGQTSLLVVALTLAAIDLAPRNQILAGVLFGLALSKFSVVLPVLLWFALYRRHRTILVALTVQGAGLLVLSYLSRAAPWTLLESYGLGLALAAKTYAARGNQFGTQSLFEHLHLPPGWGYLAVAVIVLAALASLYPWSRRGGVRSFVEKTAKADSMGPILACALLLVLPIPLLYHAAYDALGIVMLPIALFSVWAVVEVSGSRVRASFRRATLAAAAAGAAFLLPGGASVGAGASWQSFQSILLSLASLCAVGILIWLCRKYPEWLALPRATGASPGPETPIGSSPAAPDGIHSTSASVVG